MSFRIDGVMVLTAVGVITVGGAAYLIKKKGGALVDAVNPASDKNIVNKGINNIAGSLGVIGKDQTLGTAFYDATHEEYNSENPGASTEFSWPKAYTSFSPYVSYLNPAATLGTGVAKVIDKATTADSGTDFKDYLGYLNPAAGAGNAVVRIWNWATK